MAEPMIARVVRMHSRIAGITPDGIPYSANDGSLLTWVHATAAYGFANAYSRYAEALTSSELDDYYQEGLVASRLYGATHNPGSTKEARVLFDSMKNSLGPSPVIFRFLQIMRDIPALP